MLPGTLLAEDRYEATREELEALQSRLESVQETLRTRRSERDDVQEAIARLDRNVGEARRRLRALEDEAEENRERAEALEAEYREETARLSDERDALTAELRSAWLTGSRGGLRILLDGRDPADIQRLLLYHEAWRTARTERVEALLAELAELAELSARLDERLDALAVARKEVRDERRRLAERRAERQAERERLAQRIAEAESRAETLEADVAERESLLEDLREELADIPDRQADGFESFAAARGRLPWPADGDLDGRFGDRRSGDLRRTGIVLATEDEADVRAVAPGRVVFSDWLRGLGLLVIIDHGDGYLTLYGHAQALYADVGDWVDTGQTVAVAGTSGARTRPGVYFEIRSGEQPQNPADWLR